MFKRIKGLFEKHALLLGVTAALVFLISVFQLVSKLTDESRVKRVGIEHLSSLSHQETKLYIKDFKNNIKRKISNWIYDISFEFNPDYHAGTITRTNVLSQPTSGEHVFLNSNINSHNIIYQYDRNTHEWVIFDTLSISEPLASLSVVGDYLYASIYGAKQLISIKNKHEKLHVPFAGSEFGAYHSFTSDKYFLATNLHRWAYVDVDKSDRINVLGDTVVWAATDESSLFAVTNKGKQKISSISRMKDGKWGKPISLDLPLQRFELAVNGNHAVLTASQPLSVLDIRSYCILLDFGAEEIVPIDTAGSGFSMNTGYYTDAFFIGDTLCFENNGVFAAEFGKPLKRIFSDFPYSIVTRNDRFSFYSQDDGDSTRLYVFGNSLKPVSIESRSALTNPNVTASKSMYFVEATEDEWGSVINAYDKDGTYPFYLDKNRIRWGSLIKFNAEINWDVIASGILLVFGIAFIVVYFKKAKNDERKEPDAIGIQSSADKSMIDESLAATISHMIRVRSEARFLLISGLLIFLVGLVVFTTFNTFVKLPDVDDPDLRLWLTIARPALILLTIEGLSLFFLKQYVSLQNEYKFYYLLSTKKTNLLQVQKILDDRKVDINNKVYEMWFAKMMDDTTQNFSATNTDHKALTEKAIEEIVKNVTTRANGK
jgi:hypothetical protein